MTNHLWPATGEGRKFFRTGGKTFGIGRSSGHRHLVDIPSKHKKTRHYGRVSSKKHTHLFLKFGYRQLFNIF